MTDKYLIRCQCGQEVAAAANQAGSQLACECGAKIEVPTLRKLKHYPRQRQAAAASPRSTWSGRESLAMAGAVLTACLLAWAGWLWATQPRQAEFDPTFYRNNVEAMLEESSPLDLWMRWHLHYRSLPERGFEEMTNPQKDALDAYIAQRQLSRNVVLGAAGVVAVATVIGWVAWPAPRR